MPTPGMPTNSHRSPPPSPGTHRANSHRPKPPSLRTHLPCPQIATAPPPHHAPGVARSVFRQWRRPQRAARCRAAGRRAELRPHTQTTLGSREGSVARSTTKHSAPPAISRRPPSPSRASKHIMSSGFWPGCTRSLTSRPADQDVGVQGSEFRV